MLRTQVVGLNVVLTEYKGPEIHLPSRIEVFTLCPRSFYKRFVYNQSKTPVMYP